LSKISNLTIKLKKYIISTCCYPFFGPNTKKIQKKIKQCHFIRHCSSSSSSPVHATGEEKHFVFSFCFLSLRSPPPPAQTLSKPKTQRNPHLLWWETRGWWKTRESCPASDAPIGHLARHRGRVWWPRSPCTTMGQR